MRRRTPSAAPRPGQGSLRARRTARRLFIGAAVASVLAIGGSTLGRHSVRLVHNASDSVPRGWYRIEPADRVAVGDIVLVQLPPEAAALAAQRGYLPLGVPLLKSVIARSGQEVCVVGRQIRIDGTAVAQALEQDRTGRAMPRWTGCRALDAEELMLIAPGSVESFDGRYFGPVTLDAVIGKARRLGPD